MIARMFTYSIDGGPMTTANFGTGSTALTAECVNAMLKAQGIPVSVVVRPAGTPAHGVQHCTRHQLTEESPSARPHHHPNCQWKPGKSEPDGRPGFRGWLCDPRCTIPELLAYERAADCDW